VKALSLTQPWATLVALGAKRIETRSWSTSFRGPIAIHASKRFPRDCQELCANEPFLSVLKAAGFTNTNELPNGAIVAMCRLVHVFLTGDTLNYHDRSRTIRGPNGLTYEITPQEIAFGDYSPGRYGWALAEVCRLPQPIPAKGSLGLWNVQLPEPAAGEGK
jgi:hypothetical protein